MQCSIHTNTRMTRNRCPLCLRERMKSYSNYVRSRNGLTITRPVPIREPARIQESPPIQEPAPIQEPVRIQEPSFVQGLEVIGRNITSDFNDLIELEDVSTGITLYNLNYNSDVKVYNGCNLCVICLETMDKCIVRKIKCSHEFHIKCIDKWFESKNSCPTCRRKYTL